MSKLEDLAFVPEQFSGRARLFPLPNLVMFPHVMQPLHVFEDRYRQLLAEAMADDRLIAMAILRAGWEADYEGRPPLHSVGCLGRVAAHQQQPDGRANILLLGLRRVRIVRELPPDKLFREAEVEVLDDEYPPSGANERAAMQRQLLEVFEKSLPNLQQTREQIEQVLGSSVSLGMLTDIVSYSVELGLSLKQQLLEEPNVDRRAALLVRTLQDKLASTEDSSLAFPPGFSVN